MCDELNDARIDEASRVRVWLRTIDAFVEEHETIIKENGGKALSRWLPLISNTLRKQAAPMRTSISAI